MKIKSYPHIQILIEDNKKFADIALLVDNPYYIRETNKVRNKLAIEQVFKGSLRDLERYPYTKGEVKQTIPTKQSVNNFNKYYQKTTKTVNSKLEQWTNKQLMMNLLYQEAKMLLVKFGCPYLMLRAVVASVVCDRVLDEDYQLAKIDFIDQYRFEGVFKDIPALAIEITPFTNKAELEEEFEKKHMFYSDYLAFYRHLNENLSKDAISTIKRDRNWFWVKSKKPKGFYLRAALEREKITLENYLEAKDVVNGKVKKSDEEYSRYEKMEEYIQASILYIKKRVSNYKKLINTNKFIEPQILS